jgi:hypothetical protein
MLTRLRAQLSPALVISLIALFVSLGGAGYAAVTVTGKDVKNSSLTGKDVKNSSLTGKDVKNSSLTGSDVKNSSLTGKDVKDGSLAGADIKGDSLTGSQILESQLGKVPSATTADQAGTAGNAGTVGGFAVRRIDFFKRPPTTGATEVLNFNGLKLEAACDVAGDLAVVATNTGTTTAQIHSDTTTNGAASNVEDDQFDPGDTLDIMGGSAVDNNSTATTVYARSGGPTVTISSLQEDTTACTYVGTAIGG